MSASLVVKNTFICVVEDEVLGSPMGSRNRAKTIDVASLSRQLAQFRIDEDSEEEEMRKCPSAPAALDTNQRVARLAAGLDMGGAAATAAVDEIRHIVRELVFDAAGSSLVLRALEVARTSEARDLAEGLRGLVGEASRSPLACRVLEQIVRSLSMRDAAFIAEELLAEGPSSLMLNASGSSILCRLIEYSSADARTQALVDAVLSADVAVLCGHKFGHEVAMSILSNGSLSQRGQILSALRGDVQRFARQRFSSKVFEHALAICSDVERDGLASEVLARPSTLVALACHNFGINVVRALLDMPRVAQHVQMLLVRSSGRVSRDKFGLELMRELGLSKQQPKQVLDLSRELGFAERAVYEAEVMMFGIGGA